MVLSILVTFCLIVIIIGLATAKLNVKPPCEHHWVETEEGDIKCTKCYRMIHHVQEMSDTELDAELANGQNNTDKPLRPEGIKIYPQVLKEAS